MFIRVRSRRLDFREDGRAGENGAALSPVQFSNSVKGAVRVANCLSPGLPENRETGSQFLMPKMSLAGKNHGRAGLVRDGDRLRIALGAARLRHRADARIEQQLQPVGERK